MLNKLRYGIVLAAGAVIITAVAVFAEPKNAAVPEASGNTAQKSELLVSDKQSGREGGSSSEVPVIEPSMDPERFDVNVEIPESRSSETEETKETETTTAETETETESETQTEPEEPPVGIRSYFSGKLTVNNQKVPKYLNVREQPDETSEILAVLYPGDVVQYGGPVDGWYRLNLGEEYGYVLSDLVLTDNDAYEAKKHFVTYTVTTNKETVLFEGPSRDTEGIRESEKGMTYQVKDVVGAFIEVYVAPSAYYSSLFLPAEDCVLWYYLLSNGEENGLSPEVEEYLGSLDLSANPEEIKRIEAEAAAERAAREAELARLREEQRREEERRAAEAAAIQASLREEALQQAHQAATTGEPVYLGSFRVTHYCNCRLCNHQDGSDDPNAIVHGYSGQPLIVNYSVAVDMNQIPLGSRLLINGQEYMAVDIGVPAFCVDIFVATHSEALARGLYYTDVYLLP